jgi:hypothetical protein
VSFNKLFLVAVVSVFLFSIANAAVIVERSANASATNQSLFAVSLSIMPVDTSKYDIAELFPVGWSLNDWQVSGNDTLVTFEQQQTIYQGSQVQMFHWNFSDNKNALLTYDITPPPGVTGQTKLISVVVYPGGFNTNTYLLTVKEGGVVEQVVSVQPIIELQQYSTLIVAGIFAALVMILIYYAWSSKKKLDTGAKPLVLPVKQTTVQKPATVIQKLEVLPPEPEALIQELEAPAPKMETLFQKPKASVQKPGIVVQKPVDVPKKPIFLFQKPVAPTSKPAAPVPQGPAVPASPVARRPAATSVRARAPKPAKPKQVKKPAKKKKPTKFYKDTLRKLERIEKNLKK